MEKGGRGFSLPSKGGGGKSSLIPVPSSVGGKNGGSVKSKRGRKVHFDAEGSPEGKFSFSSKSDGKFETNYGGSGKGGRGGKVGNDGKASLVKESLPLELRIEQELPRTAKCLMDCEAASILEGIQEQIVVLSADPTIKIPVSFDRGLLYAKTRNHYTDPQAVRKVLDTLTKHGVNDGEICLVANICPETAEEAFALIPSLKAKRSTLSDPLKDVLLDVAKFRKTT